MLIEKEVIRPGCYFYTDEKTGLPRKLVVTPELCKHWHDQGNAMLSAGLTVPVPYEHDFSAHPMTPKDKLLNNAGEVKAYTLKGNKLFSSVDVQDPDVKGKIGHSIRWTSPWINSFTDGSGKTWNNVISHLALTTRPRIVEQQPFSSIAAALSMAADVRAEGTALPSIGTDGFCLTRAARLGVRKSTNRIEPCYPVAFSLFTGVALGAGDFPPKKGKPDGKKPGDGDQTPDDDFEDEDDDDDSNDETIDLEPLGDSAGDVSMVELLCDLLGALGIQVQHAGDEAQFKRELYNAAMTEIHTLTGKAKSAEEQPNRTNPIGMSPNTKKPDPNKQGQNPIVQQEQQPMFMSLDEINKLPDPMRGVALAMHAENQKLRADLDASSKTTNGLRDAKLAEATEKRKQRVAFVGKFMPHAKSDLEAMLSLPSMALSLGDAGVVNDPMAVTLNLLEKGMADLPKLLTTDASALSIAAQPTDETMLSDARVNEIADGLARMMGAPAEPATK